MKKRGRDKMARKKKTLRELVKAYRVTLRIGIVTNVHLDMQFKYLNYVVDNRLNRFYWKWQQ